MIGKRITRLGLATWTAVVYAFLLVPPLYIVYLSFFPTPSPAILVPDEFTTEWYLAIFDASTLVESFETSIIASALTAVLATVLSLLGARGYMKLSDRWKRHVLRLLLLPVFVPATVFGLALLAFFSNVGVETGLVTLVTATTLWAMPFATLILLTSMSNLDSRLRNASYDLGASRSLTFLRVDVPLIMPGLLGAFFFSFLLAFNEFARSLFVAGRSSTVPLYLYNQTTTGTVPPELYAVSAVTVILTAALLGVMLLRTIIGSSE